MDDRASFSPQSLHEAEASKPEVKPLVVLNACAAKFFKKTLGGLTFYDSNKGNNWDLSSPVCVDFVNRIGKKFSKSGRIYGYVDPNMLSAAANFSKYASDLEFDTFVNGVMDRLCDEANDPARRSLNEGYVVFSHYQDHRQVDHLLIVMLGKQAGYDFDNDNNLNPKDTESLNLQDFRQAACMDLTEFKKGFPKNTGDSYLYFIKGNSKSEFFTVALGCSDSIPGKVCVDNLKNALGAYLQEEASTLSLTERRTIHKRVVEYIESKAGERVHLSEIQHVINKCLKEDSPHHGGLVKFISENSERFKVSEEFQPSGITAKSMAFTNIKLPSGEFDGRFKLDAVAVGDSDADLSVDKDFVYLKVKLPIEVSNQLRSINAGGPASGSGDA
ncbi:nucleoid-associated protein [Pseudomonas hamedanensis]|uniref:Nucleoid-associated protein n=1 Tax=Pseudomonas hamedanensis TaxID=2745504 RepID=A0A9E6P3P1_9PSED|nr:nucleoid-associated protein [Pseudomonas hamedanensis]QXI18865.1 nucleoid-associated protein [Pseudomonas hamedanensis]